MENATEMREPQMPGIEEKNWALVCHLAALAGFIIPFGNIIGPLVVWLIKRDEMPFVDYHGKEALNFQITMTLLFVVALILIIVLIGILLTALLGIYWLIMIIVAAIAANNGQRFVYPFTLRLIQ